MKKPLSSLTIIALAFSSFAQSQGVSMRSTNGIGYGTTVINSLVGKITTGNVTNAAGSRVAYLSDTNGLGTSGSALTNNDTRAINLTNSANQFAGANFTNTSLTASRLKLTDANNGEVSAAASGAVPVDANGTATTFAQINSLAPGGDILTNTRTAATLSGLTLTGPTTNTAQSVPNWYGGLWGTNPATGNQWQLTNGGGVFTASNNLSTAAPLIVLSNSVQATSGNPKGSGQIRLSGSGFSTGISSSTNVDFNIQVIPTSAATATGLLVISNNIGGGASSDIFRLTSAGALTTASAINTTAGSISSFADLVLGTSGALYGPSLSGLGYAFQFGSTVNRTLVIKATTALSKGITNMTWGVGTTNIALQCDDAATPTLTLLAASGSGGAHLAINGLLSLQPLGSTQTNAANLGIWNSNNFALYVRNTNGVDKLLIAIP